MNTTKPKITKTIAGTRVEITAAAIQAASESCQSYEVNDGLEPCLVFWGIDAIYDWCENCAKSVTIVIDAKRRGST
jgi:hypothetical protein